ncbi:hypothetical protein Afil01_53090 [Actinorhabdospora filicis]|uniref:Uncharacterized protein n=1 Tax=Actinorhabdospora filicis TaxID=1785913 RepID=A0A9W6SQU1_9ACTN|nr:hypothetical protein [Actinorhabdospora filicis]GLZ80502.1 hypothetical protein Afil01_53090 [Actinorhabdospora filicis]
MATAGLVTVASLMMAVIVAVGAASVNDDGTGSAAPEPMLAGAGEPPTGVTPTSPPDTLDASPDPTDAPVPPETSRPAPTPSPTDPTREPTPETSKTPPPQSSSPLFPTAPTSPNWPTPWPTEDGGPTAWPTDDPTYIEFPWWYWCWVQPWGAQCQPGG